MVGKVFGKVQSWSRHHPYTISWEIWWMLMQPSCQVKKYPLVNKHSYWKWMNMAHFRWFTYHSCWFSIAILNRITIAESIWLWMQPSSDSASSQIVQNSTQQWAVLAPCHSWGIHRNQWSINLSMWPKRYNSLESCDSWENPNRFSRTCAILGKCVHEN